MTVNAIIQSTSNAEQKSLPIMKISIFTLHMSIFLNLFTLNSLYLVNTALSLTIQLTKKNEIIFIYQWKIQLSIKHHYPSYKLMLYILLT